MKKVLLILLPVSIMFFLYNIYTNIRVEKTAVETSAFNVGSSNYEVFKIEEKLKYLGYFSSIPDYYYGNDTRESIKKFQKVRGLDSNGSAGEDTLAELEVAASPSQYNRDVSKGNKGYLAGSSNTSLLARAINGEARGEPYEGQVAIGAVIINRTRDPRFPKTIPGVIYQPGAFTAVSDGQINAQIEKSPTKAARDALNGWDPTGGCVYYFNPATATSKWIWSRPLVKVIGKHHFCK